MYSIARFIVAIRADIFTFLRPVSALGAAAVTGRKQPRRQNHEAVFRAAQ